ncbi:MAG: hypothetical protein ACRDYX_08050 [Egibacteraceae bacterium]
MAEREPSGARWVLPWDWEPWSITALIKACGCSQNGFALQAGISSSALTNWLHKGVAPSAASAKQLYRAWAGLPEADREIFAALLANASRGKVVPMDRRQTLLAALAALSIPAEVVERILAGGAVDASLVAGHEVMADVLAERLWSARIDALLPLVDREASVLLGLLDLPMGGEERRRLEALAIGAHVQAAHLALDAHRRTDARRYIALAKDVADDSTDPALQAQAMAASALPGMFRIAVHGRDSDPSPTGKILSGALERARGADGRIRAWLHRWMGVVLAAKNDERGFRFHAEQADRAFDEAPAVGPVGFLDRYAATEGRETGMTEARGFMLLGRADDADAALARALAAAAPDWTSWQAMLLVDVAAVRVLQDAPKEACDSLVAALALAGEAGFSDAVGRVLAVRSTFPKPWAAKRCVQELDDLLRLLTA